MELSFILGPAGSGKTRSCLEGVREALARGPEGPAAILLVPEQMTFQVEAEVARLVGPSPRAHVLSFQRLAVRVFSQVGGAARPRLDEIGRKMVLRAILEQNRGQLELFGPMADKPGFLDLLSHSLREFRAHGQGPAELADLLDRLDAPGERRVDPDRVLAPPYLRRKLHDLAIVMRALETHLEGRFTDPDLTLALLAARVGQSQLLAGAEVWVDGFFGFTPEEYRVLCAVIERAGRVHVALCLDDREGLLDYPENALFRPTLDTYARLLEIVSKHGFDSNETRLWGHGALTRFAQAPALARVERELASPPKTGGELPGSDREVPAGPQGAGDAILLVRAPDRRTEIEAVAVEILRLCRDDGYRFREIAVVARDLEAYNDLAEGIFEALAIPVFVDRRRSMAHHPVVELVRSALEAVWRNWPTDAILRYLKSDLTPVARTEVDRLENFVLEHGIKGRRWFEGEWEFRRRPVDTDEAGGSGSRAAAREESEAAADIEDIRRRAIAALARFADRAKAASTVRNHSEAIFALLEDLDVAGTLTGWIERDDLTSDHEGVFTGLLELLDQTVGALGDLEVTARSFAAILEAGLSSLQLGLVPPTRDQVLLGTIERSRHPDIRAMFIIGAQLGTFPRPVPEDPFLDDVERARMAAAGCEIGPASRALLFNERYLLYIAATRASERLYVSYPMIDAEGRGLMPSQLFARLEAMAEVRDLSLNPQGLEAIASVGQLAEAVALNLRAGRTVPWRAVLGWAEREFETALRPVVAALAPRRSEPPLAAPLAEALMLRPGGPRRFLTSVSRLESFGACPFQYFARFGLRLGTRRRWELDASDVGVLEHAALRHYVHERHLESAEAAATDPSALVARIAARLAGELKGAILLDSGRNRHLLAQITRTLQEAATALDEHDRRGRFRAARLEVAFGAGRELEALVVTLPDGVELAIEGQIDRLDQAELAGVSFVRVIDYKRSHRRFSVAEAALGLSMQLPVYLSVARRGARQQAAGMLYFPVQGGWVDGPMDEEAARRKLLQNHKARGLISADGAVARLMEEPAGSGHSDLLEVYWKTDGTLGSASKVATSDQFEALERHVLEVVKQYAGRIRQGEIDPDPYRVGLDRTPCTYCDYRSVCRFDPASGDRPRQLVVPSEEEAWQTIASSGLEVQR